jgi:hypothetical protein
MRSRYFKRSARKASDAENLARTIAAKSQLRVNCQEFDGQEVHLIRKGRNRSPNKRTLCNRGEIACNIAFPNAKKQQENAHWASEAEHTLPNDK